MFQKGRHYRRRDIHEMHGGQVQSGISTPKDYPVIFLFTGDSGSHYGYRDGWNVDGIFRYSGEGQKGDMQMLRGNAAIANHERDGKTRHLFEAEGEEWLRKAAEAIPSLLPDMCRRCRWPTDLRQTV